MTGLAWSNSGKWAVKQKLESVCVSVLLVITGVDCQLMSSRGCCCRSLLCRAVA